jgi:hypothetical protein
MAHFPPKFDAQLDDELADCDFSRAVAFALSDLGKYTGETWELEGETTRVAEPKKRNELEGLYDAWFDFYIIYRVRLVAIVTLPGGRKDSLNWHLIAELSRLHALLMRPKALALSSTPVRLQAHTKNDGWVRALSGYNLKPSIDEKGEELDSDEYRRGVEQFKEMKELWNLPVVNARLSQIKHLILFMSGEVDQAGSEWAGEFIYFFEWIWYRLAILQIFQHSEEVLDVEAWRTLLPKQNTIPPKPPSTLYIANRQFYAFSAFYLGPMIERIYFYRLLSVRRSILLPDAPRIAEIATRARQWVTTIVHETPSEAFEDAYVRSCETSYRLPGDDDWFKFCHPSGVLARGLALQELRPHLFLRFFSEGSTTKEFVLQSAVNSHPSRCYVLRTLADFIQTKMRADVRWDDAVVLHGDEVAGSTYLLLEDGGVSYPVLIQCLGDYWVYLNGRVHKTGNIYEAIGVWFYLLHHDCEARLFGRSLAKFTRPIVEGRDRAKVEGRFNI